LCFLEEIYDNMPRCVIVLSTGGGGDVATALLYAYKIAEEGSRAIVAALPWERYVKDPCPGPIKLSEIASATTYHDYALLHKGCIAYRCGRVLVPAVCKAALLLNNVVPIYAVDGWRGELGIRRAIKELSTLHGCDSILLVDVGGDVLAEGHEKELWSPLGDSLGLAAAINSDLPSALLVQGPGADGELSDKQLYRIIAELAKRGALMWVRGLSARDAKTLEHITSVIHTEAGRIPLLAFKGFYGWYEIRGGTRRVWIDVSKATAVILRAEHVYKFSKPAQIVAGTTSLHEARRRLNEHGVYTELDLEEDIHALIELGELTPGKLLKIREKSRSSLRRGDKK
jgi:hypothetical protein